MGYAYSLKNQLSDKEKLGGKLSEDEQSKIEEVINEKIAWLEENQDASADDLRHKRKKWRILCSPSLLNYTKVQVDPLQKVERRRKMRLRMSCSVQLVNSFIGVNSQYGHVNSVSK